MPRYFFDAYDGRQHSIDPQGEDLGDDREARDQAMAVINALIRDDRNPRGGRCYHVSVRRDEAFVVYRIGGALTETRRGGDEHGGQLLSLQGLACPDAERG